MGIPAPAPNEGMLAAIDARANENPVIEETFIVNGKHKVKGVKRGGEVTLRLREENVLQLLSVGAIKRKPAPPSVIKAPEKKGS